MLKYYKQAREEIIPFGESKYKEAAPLGLFCAVAPPEVFQKNRELQGSPDIGNVAPEKRVNPKLNFFAEPLTLRTVINWDRVFREPPLTCEIPSKDLHDFLDQRMAIPDFPSHTVSVERAVKRVTEAGKRHTTEDKRDGRILSQMEACRLLPKLESKQDLAELVQYAKAYKKKKPSRDQSPDQSPGPSSSV